jgi:hypothetical protein
MVALISLRHTGKKEEIFREKYMGIEYKPAPVLAN